MPARTIRAKKGRFPSGLPCLPTRPHRPVAARCRSGWPDRTQAERRSRRPCLTRPPSLSTRQEAFCRHFTASGNAADAARRAGYAERSARQTGHALLERPYIVERVRRIRMSWLRTARDEAQDRARPIGTGLGCRRRQRIGLSHAPDRPPPGRDRRAYKAGRHAPRRAVAGCRRGRVRRDGGRRMRSKPGPNRVRWPTPCAGAGTGPNARLPGTARTGRRWSGRKTSTGPRMTEPPNGSRKPSRSGTRLPVSFEPPAPPPAEAPSASRRPARGDLRREDSFRVECAELPAA